MNDDFRYVVTSGGYALEFQRLAPDGVWRVDLSNDPRELIQTLHSADYNNPPATPIMANFASAIVSLIVGAMRAAFDALDTENPTTFQWAAFQALIPLVRLAGYGEPFYPMLLTQLLTAFQYTSGDMLDAIEGGINSAMACDIYCVLDEITRPSPQSSAFS